MENAMEHEYTDRTFRRVADAKAFAKKVHGYYETYIIDENLNSITTVYYRKENEDDRPNPKSYV